MSLTIITPAEAKRRIAQGATLIDIRDKDEHAHEHIAGTRNFPLSTLTDLESRGRSSFTAAPVRQCEPPAKGHSWLGLYPRRRH